MIVTISGRIGSGKSTVADALAKKLKFRHFSTGDVMRKIAEEKHITPVELNRLAEKDPSFDRALDEKTAELGKKEDNFIMDSRLAFHFIPNSAKIFLDVSADVAADRIFRQKRAEEKENVSLEKTREKIKEREELEIKRYARLYSLDYTDASNYDLVIDTSKLDVGRIVKKIVDFLKKKK
jgi:cytidylate kinase